MVQFDVCNMRAGRWPVRIWERQTSKTETGSGRSRLLQNVDVHISKYTTSLVARYELRRHLREISNLTSCPRSNLFLPIVTLSPAN